VLARLLVSRGCVVPLDVLVDDVWDGRPPATAAKTLQKYVAELRKALLPDDALRTDGRGYLLVAGGAVDADEFERLVDAAQAARGRGEPEQAVGLWQAALGLWRGEVLADLQDLRFTAGERARLDERRLSAVEDRLEVEIELGRHGAALAELAPLIEEHPMRERLRASMLLALYRSGRQVDALRAYERYRALLAEELGLQPSDELKELERAILRRDPALGGGPVAPTARATPAPSLPAQLTTFIGRRREIGELAAALADHRLVTLTGPGGVGKTRLAIETAARPDAHHPGGAWFVDLAPVTDGSLVGRTVARALGLDERPETPPVDVVAEVLCHREPALILLDNCEHLAAACADFADRLLRSCPVTRLLATSRRPLGVDGEFLWPVPPLDADPATRDGVELFFDRARLAGFELDDRQRGVVAEICQGLDGLPLAIELAAGQVRVLTPAEIAARLDARFGLLARAHAPTPRHRTLHDAVGWSYDLLSPGARQVFDRLGIFPGSFTLEAAEAVCSGGGLPRRDILGHLTELVEQSLVVRDAGPPAVARYRLLDTIRLWARDRLAEQGALDQAACAHAHFVLQLATAATTHFWGPDEPVWLLRLQDEDHSIRAALDWSRRNDRVLALRLGVALFRYWDVLWLEREAVAHLEPLLAEPDLERSSTLRAWALTVAAILISNPGEARQATAWAEEAVERFRPTGDRRGLICAQLALGSALGNQGPLDRAEAVARAARDGAGELDDDELMARAQHILGFVAARRGDHDRATAAFHDELDHWTRRGSCRGRGSALRNLAAARLAMGDLDGAVGFSRDALELFTEIGDTAAVAHVRLTLADVERVRGRLAEAERMYVEALDDLRAIGDRRCIASTAKNRAALAARQDEPSRAAELYVEALVLRHQMGDDAGLAECLEGLAACAITADAAADAASLLGAARGVRDRCGTEPPPLDREQVERTTDAVRADLDDQGFERAWKTGCGLTPSEAVELARRSLGRAAPDGPVTIDR
jgi:predicted ATPase/DNA-binding SARP family transcriptional activator